MKYRIVLFTDGGSRGNPGKSAIGGVIIKEGEKIKTFSEYLGIATNNQAEYKAMLFALKWVLENIPLDEIESMHCYADSQLLIEQLNGNYKVKNEGIIPLFNEAKQLIEKLNLPIVFQYVPRAKNQVADTLVNQALDAQK